MPPPPSPRRSVPGVEASPDFTNIHNGLSVAVVAAAACSLNYLRTRAEMLAQVWREAVNVEGGRRRREAGFCGRRETATEWHKEWHT